MGPATLEMVARGALRANELHVSSALSWALTLLRPERVSVAFAMICPSRCQRFGLWLGRAPYLSFTAAASWPAYSSKTLSSSVLSKSCGEHRLRQPHRPSPASPPIPANISISCLFPSGEWGRSSPWIAPRRPPPWSSRICSRSETRGVPPPREPRRARLP